MDYDSIRKVLVEINGISTAAAELDRLGNAERQPDPSSPRVSPPQAEAGPEPS